MNCHEFWRTPPGAARDGQRQRHLAECAACAAQEQRRRNLTGVLRSIAADSRGVGAPARVEARLVAAFRTRNGIAAPRGRSVWSGMALWASAAAAVIALAFLLVSGHEPQAPRQHAQNAMELAVLQEPAGHRREHPGGRPRGRIHSPAQRGHAGAQ